MTVATDSDKSSLNDIDVNIVNNTDGKVIHGRTYESVIDDLGGFGRWQALIFFLICIPDFFTAFALVLPIYTGAQPEFSCVTKGRHVVVGNGWNLSTAHNSSVTTPAMKTAVPTRPADICTGCHKFEYEAEYTSVVTEWDLVCDRDYVSDLITSVQMLGMLFGAMILGQFSDIIGRKKVHFGVCFVLMVAGMLSAMSINWQMYTVLRFLAGMCCGGYYTVSCVYPLEFVGRKWRTLCGTLGFWAIAQMVLALLGYFITNWRWLTFATSAATGFYFIFWSVIPESPRWLTQKGKVDEAEKIICNIAKRNKVPPPDLTVLQKEKCLLEETKRIQKEEGRKRQIFSYLDLFKTKKMAVLTLATTFLWFSSFLTFYFLTYNIKNLTGNRYVNMFIAGMTDFAVMLVVIFVNNTLGRRKGFASFGIATSLCNVCMLVFLLTGLANSAPTVFTWMVLVAKAVSVGLCYVAQIFTAEVYPTCIRNCGVAAGQVAARIGSMIAPQIVYMGSWNVTAPYIIITILTLVSLPLCFVLPETKGKPLLDTMEIIVDGNQETKRIDTFNTSL